MPVTTELVLLVVAGAKAAAEPANRERTATVFMVDRLFT
jgi:hypothetical protein